MCRKSIEYLGGTHKYCPDCAAINKFKYGETYHAKRTQEALKKIRVRKKPNIVPHIPKICEWCGKEFKGCRIDTRFCSQPCRVANYSYNHNKDNVKLERVGCVDKCERCGKDYVVKQSHQRFCSPYCTRKKWKELHERKTAFRVGEIRKCAREECGNEFKAVNIGHKYCNPKCDWIVDGRRKNVVKSEFVEYRCVKCDVSFGNEYKRYCDSCMPKGVNDSVICNGGVIYGIYNSVNQRVYIGSSSEYVKRSRCHASNLLCGNHVCEDMQSDFNEFGGGAFSFDVYENLCDGISRTEMQRIERGYIRCVDKGRLYNHLT